MRAPGARRDGERHRVQHTTRPRRRGLRRSRLRWLHVVDLDGAFAGKPVNGEAVRAISPRDRRCRSQLGGGIRDRAAIDDWLDAGIERVVLGTAALRDPELVTAARRQDYPGRVAVGIDARDGLVAVEGWAETSDDAALDLALRFERCRRRRHRLHRHRPRRRAGRRRCSRRPSTLARALTTPVIASGGVASIDDIAALQGARSDRHRRRHLRPRAL